MRSIAMLLLATTVNAMTHMQHAKQQWHEYHIYILNTTQKFLIASHRYFTFCIFLFTFIYTFIHHLHKYSILNHQVYTCMSSNKQSLWYTKFIQSWYRPYLFSFEMQQQRTMWLLSQKTNHIHSLMTKDCWMKRLFNIHWMF